VDSMCHGNLELVFHALLIGVLFGIAPSVVFYRWTRYSCVIGIVGFNVALFLYSRIYGPACVWAEYVEGVRSLTDLAGRLIAGFGGL